MSSRRQFRQFRDAVPAPNAYQLKSEVTKTKAPQFSLSGRMEDKKKNEVPSPNAYRSENYKTVGGAPKSSLASKHYKDVISITPGPA